MPQQVANANCYKVAKAVATAKKRESPIQAQNRFEKTKEELLLLKRNCPVTPATTMPPITMILAPMPPISPSMDVLVISSYIATPVMPSSSFPIAVVASLPSTTSALSSMSLPRS